MPLTPKEAKSLRERGAVVDDSDIGDADGNEIVDTDVEVKGPDPAVWGDDTERPSAEPEVDDVPRDDNGDPVEVKGPDPEVWG